MYLQRHQNCIRPLVPIALLLAAALATGCGSCGADEEEEATPDASATAESSEKQEEDSGADQLEQAQEKAEEDGDSVAFERYQHARLVASEVEGAQVDVDAPSPAPKPAPKKHRDTGNIDVEAVQQLFRTKHGNLQTCYERALKRNESLQGKVVMSIRVGTDGSPLLVQAKSNAIHDQTALDCMEREAKSWQFPRPTGGTVMLNKPFRFTPNG